LTIVVLLVLVLVWAVVLVPSLLKRTAERRSDSIGAFHRHLRVLQRTTPGSGAPERALAASGDFERMARAADGEDHAVSERQGIAEASPNSATRTVVQRCDPYFRAGACKRRRDVVIVLVSAVLVTAAIGALPAARPILIITPVLVAVLVAYVALLLRMRNRAVEREMKLRYLPEPIDRQPAMVIRRAAMR
jgi:hypothetical protein